MIRDRFISEERLKNESATLRILQGTFNNPFQHMRTQNGDNNKNSNESNAQVFKNETLSKQKVSNSPKNNQGENSGLQEIQNYQNIL